MLGFLPPRAVSVPAFGSKKYSYLTGVMNGTEPNSTALTNRPGVTLFLAIWLFCLLDFSVADSFYSRMNWRAIPEIAVRQPPVVIQPKGSRLAA
jgi:hypothetical protein